MLQYTVTGFVCFGQIILCLYVFFRGWKHRLTGFVAAVAAAELVVTDGGKEYKYLAAVKNENGNNWISITPLEE